MSALPEILRLILGLAIYEKAPESAQATPALLKQNLFGAHPYAHTLLAFVDGKAVAIAMYFFNFSTWKGKPGLYLEDLFVEPEYRKMGIGKALFGELGRVAEVHECGRMDWSVLKWNQPSIDFYEKALGAFGMKEWEGMRLEEEGIKGLRRLRVPEATAPQ
ncbi:acyl-CoA N-acyltransferase [Dacryopinax primogenitus]|uniref:Acyl-CoA N-acyltransferase n=1 Tax=Dacryopinax primogenitus (strain DJM 731) TaxID=1858805 RepID=M5G2B3_DACPD|nr:acyl-CoA N-acyltransferase [Dacryopinax primogenitus]EJU02355.1 acyl-CoA N-acyltransferase [Dacryopinax primogenitus]